MGTSPDAKPGLCDVLIKVEARGITHNELDWPIYDEPTGLARSRSTVCCLTFRLLGCLSSHQCHDRAVR